MLLNHHLEKVKDFASDPSIFTLEGMEDELKDIRNIINQLIKGQDVDISLISYAVMFMQSIVSSGELREKEVDSYVSKMLDIPFEKRKDYLQKNNSGFSHLEIGQALERMEDLSLEMQNEESTDYNLNN